MARSKIKPVIIECLQEGPKTLEEIINYVQERTGAQPRIIKGIITKMVKRGELRKTDNTYELVG